MEDHWPYAEGTNRMPKTSAMFSILVTAKTCLGFDKHPQELIFFSEILYTLKMETVRTSEA
jgi:hypothetical protein